jgi:uncharacterized protein YkwD
MNWVDYTILAVFIFYLFEGIRRGFIEQTLELIGFFVTVFLALWLYHPLSGWVITHTGIEQLGAEPIAFFLSWFVLQVAYSLLLHLLYPLVPTFIRSNLPNRLAGLIPAFLKGFILVSIILTIIIILPVPAKLKSEIDDSVIGSRFVAQSSTVEQYLNKVFHRDVKQSLTFLTVAPQTEQIIPPTETVDLKFKATDVTVDTQSERKMFDLVNQERQKAGVPLLKWDEKLADVARAHSKDMMVNGFFSHTGLGGDSPFDRMAKAGIVFKTAGENIAYAATVDLAHNGLMRSPGHRANILDKDFGTIGIGVIDGGIYGKMFSQEFTN